MKFVYVGAEGAPLEARVHGLCFRAGDPVDVSDERVVAKLGGHPHFVRAAEWDGVLAVTPTQDDSAVISALRAELATARARIAELEAMGGRADGPPVAGDVIDTLSKEQVLDYARRHGIMLDGRRSEANLRDDLRAALAPDELTDES